AVTGPAGESGQCRGGAAEGGGAAGADHAGKEGKFENVLRPFKGFPAGGKASDQEATDQTFEGVSRRYAERGGDGTGGGPVYQERPGQNGGPYAIAEDEEGGEREAGA